MKRWKKIGLVLLGVIVLSQLPFAWRRYRLRRLNNAIQQLAGQHSVSQSPGNFRDFKGVIHVHSFLGGHSTGTFNAIIEAAARNGLDFVIMTEHPAKDFDTSALTLNGIHRGMLFVAGNEVSTANGDRLLLIPGDVTADVASSKSTSAVIAEQKARGGRAIVAYPAEFHSWQAGDYDGVEVYNLFTNARRINPLVMFFDGLWAYGSYADLMFANFYERPSQALQSWDSAIVASRRPLVATGGNDAHANIGLSLNDSGGKQILGVKLDPYERSFRVVRTHVLLATDQLLNRENLLAAIGSGHCYVSFDLFADPNGFGFTAENESGTKNLMEEINLGNDVTLNVMSEPGPKTMGDEISLRTGVTLKVTSPIAARVVLFKDGTRIDEASGVSYKEFPVAQTGAYRVEVYLPQLPHPVHDQPWIISNPIYVR
ncbi:MAG: hypothetical protein QOD75_2184 [Blastocatellia bacterium]|jgi:hypothetical protein|nr:hypothetical protein [Blastocatellia bacterium]